MNRTRLFLPAVVILLVTALLSAQEPAAPSPAAPPAKPARENGLYATIETSLGNIVVQLFEKEAPATVRSFVALSKGTKSWTNPKTGAKMVGKPLYSNVLFHRVIPGFMIQTGDPKGDGTGDVGFTIPDEFVPSLKYDRPGRLGMANIGQPHTGASQFFITLAPTMPLNNKHTIFGQVIEGQDVTQNIAAVPKKRNSMGEMASPITPVYLKTVIIERVGPEPEKPKPPAHKTKPA